MGVLIGFLPWILFWFLTAANEFEPAAVAGLVASAAWLVWTRVEHKELKLLDIGGTVFFAVMIVVFLTAEADWFARWSFTLSNAALGGIMLLSIVVGRPFTRQYAKESTPPELWETAPFKHITLVLTWMWVVIMAVNTVLSWLAVEFPDQDLWLSEILPIASIIVGLRLNHWYPEHERARLQAGGS